MEQRFDNFKKGLQRSGVFTEEEINDLCEALIHEEKLKALGSTGSTGNNLTKEEDVIIESLTREKIKKMRAEELDAAGD